MFTLFTVKFEYEFEDTKMVSLSISVRQQRDVMVNVPASSSVDCGFKHGRVKPKTRKWVYVPSPLGQQHEGEEQSWLRIKLICQYGATCLPADSCFSEHSKSPTKRFGVVQSG